MAIDFKTHPDMVLCKPLGFTPSNGIAHVECTKCETRYPINNGGKLLCNGTLYTDCPYCIADHLKALHDENKDLIKQALF